MSGANARNVSDSNPEGSLPLCSAAAGLLRSPAACGRGRPAAVAGAARSARPVPRPGAGERPFPSPQLPQRSPAPGTCCCEQTCSAGSGTPAVCTFAPGAASAPLCVPRTAFPARCPGRIPRLKDALAAPLLSGGGETSFPRVLHLSLGVRKIKMSPLTTALSERGRGERRSAGSRSAPQGSARPPLPGDGSPRRAAHPGSSALARSVLFSRHRLQEHGASPIALLSPRRASRG